MSTFKSAGRFSIAALGLCLVFAFGAKSANAASWGVNLGVSAPVYGGYNSGRYESRTERVLVYPERSERRWIAPVYQTRYTRGYAENFCVSQGYWTTVCTPARYEDRCTQVWVPSVSVYSTYGNYGGYNGGFSTYGHGGYNSYGHGGSQNNSTQFGFSYRR